MALRTSKGAFGAGLGRTAIGERAASRARTGAAVLALAATLTLAVVAPAGAGIYHVYACRTPADATAPADGWTPYAQGETATTANTCAGATGGLTAALVEREGVVSEGDEAGWRFGVPAGERLVGANVWRAGDVDGGRTRDAGYEFWLGGAGRASAFEECVALEGCTLGHGDQGEPFAAANALSAPPSSLAEGLSANVACTGRTYGCYGTAVPPLTDGYDALLVIYAADLTLEQPAGPSVTDVGGALADAAGVSGESSLTFTASEAGAGVYEALVSVDGTLLERVPLDSNGGRCEDVGGTTDGSAAFEYVQPCAATVSTSVALDTTKLSNGAHTVQVSAVDAAGNMAVVLDRVVTVENGAPCATASAQTGAAVLRARWAGTSETTITSGFSRAHTIEGTLTNAHGTPIAGVRVEAFGASASRRPTATATALTNGAGVFSIGVSGGGPSRTVCLAYHASRAPGAASTAGVATRTLGLRVRAPVSLTVTPRRVSVGGTIRFRGQLLGGEVPAGGKPVILEARSAGSGWLEFRVVRADARGRFRASYRFRFAGPANYEFRALCEAEAGYPFARGASNVARVHER